RGFIRTYCQYLGLNPDGMLDVFGPRRAIEESVRIRPIPADVAITPGFNVRPVVTLAALVLFGLVVAYLWGQYTSLRDNVGQLDAGAIPRPAPTPTIPARGAVPSPSPGPSPIPILAVGSPGPGPGTATVAESASGLVVDAKASEKTWLEVWVDGKSAMAETV